MVDLLSGIAIMYLKKLDSIVLLLKVTLFFSYYHIIIPSGLAIINCKREASKT